MPARFRFLNLAVLFAGCSYLVWQAAAQPPAEQKKEEQNKQQPDKARAPSYRFSGPFTHDNLTIFLVHGEDRLKGRKYMMLAEALEKKQFVIHETQTVKTLSMENLSATDEVLILSGDILKGGQQDRVAQFDQFVPAKSGKVDLAVFCVEHTASRWMKPLTDADKTFTSSPGQICSNDLRLANRAYNSQSDVWAKVAKAQKDLSDKAGKDVKDKASDSSLALSLQVKEVLAATEKYVAKLEPTVKDKNDVLGYAYAINGKIYATDIYCSPTLFQKAWPRMIRANAIEAFADLKKDQKALPAVKLADVTAFLEEAEKGKVSGTKMISAGQHTVTKESPSIYNINSRVPLPAAHGGAGGGGAAKKDMPALDLRSNSIAR